MKPIDPITYAYIRNISAPAFAVGNVADYCARNRKPKLIERGTLSSQIMCYHLDSSGFLTTAIYQLLVCILGPAVKKLIERLKEIATSAKLSDYLEESNHLNGDAI